MPDKPERETTFEDLSILDPPRLTGLVRVPNTRVDHVPPREEEVSILNPPQFRDLKTTPSKEK